MLCPGRLRRRFQVKDEQRHRDGEHAVAERSKTVEAASREAVIPGRHASIATLLMQDDVKAEP